MCDSFIVLSTATFDGSVIFAKNSDRPAGEGQSVCIFEAKGFEPGARVQCTYLDIPQVAHTHGVLLSRIDWMWGAEMGANEHGVVIGNEAVWTCAAREEGAALLGMDLLRLGLERGASAREALDVITSLLERFGQGGACAQDDPGFTYDNSFLIADFREAWVLETAGRSWAARRFTAGVHNISNRLTLRTDYDLASADLPALACAKGLSHIEGRVDFAALFSTAPLEVEAGSREGWGRRLLASHEGAITPDVMKNVLRHHESGICMHGGFETTSSMVSRLTADGQEDAHWLADAPNPCTASFSKFDAFRALRKPVAAG